MRFSEEWELLDLYEKFEKLVCLVLSVFIAAIILFALYKLGHHLVTLLITYGLDPLEQHAFKEIFGMIMTLLIALEFKHSIVKVVVNNESIVQVKTVILIAILAIARKMIILDTKSMDALTIFSLAGVLLALGVVYWFVRRPAEREGCRGAGGSAT